jgi:hypothetical protein
MELNIIDRQTAALEYINGVYEIAILQLRNMPYEQYLQTEHWQHFRLEALKAAQYRCQLCNGNDRQLDVHHRDYKNLGCETFNDVIVLCNPCHKTFHGKQSDPDEEILKLMENVR